MFGHAQRRDGGYVLERMFKTRREEKSKTSEKMCDVVEEDLQMVSSKGSN